MAAVVKQPMAPGPQFPASPLSLRHATTADAADVMTIWNDGLPDTGYGTGAHGFRLSPDLTLEWIANHQKALRPLWLLMVDGKPAAVLSFLGFHDRPWCHAASELAIHVRSGYRGQGIGRMLIERAIAAAPMLRFDRYVAFIRSDGFESQGLFSSCGFTRWGCLPGVMTDAGQRFDMLVFGLALDNA